MKVQFGIPLIALIFVVFHSSGVSTERTNGLRKLKGKRSAPKAPKAHKPPKSPKNPLPADLTILHINDHHSHLEGDQFDLRGDDVPSFLTDVDRLRVYYGGFPRLASLFKKLEQENTGNVLKIHAGDAVTGTLFFTLFEGEADAELMKNICFDAFVLGNHEFDRGDKLLADFIDNLNNVPDDCSTQVLSANISPGLESPLMPLVDDGTIISSMTMTLPEGQKVGVVGITIAKKTNGSSNPDPGTKITEEKAAAEAEVMKLKDQGASIIILMTHIGLTYDLEWMTDIDGVDVVVGGDSHSLMGDTDSLSVINVPVANYPEIRDKNGKKVCVVQAWEYAHGVGKLNISFDANGDVKSCQGEIVFPFDGETMTVKTDPEDYNLSPEQAAAVSNYLKELGPHLIAVKEDASTATSLGFYSEAVDGLKGIIIANAPEDICLERIPGQGKSSICTPEETASQGGGVANCVAKAFLFNVKTADFAIQNAGGCRVDIEAGEYSINDAFTLLPFSNTLVTLEMTGAEVIQVLNEALDYSFSGSTGAYPYASGLRYDIDANADIGKKFSNVEVNSRLEGDWSSIDLEKVYVVATNSFIAGGRDGYATFASIPEEKVVNTYLEYGQTFVDYCLEVKTIVDVPLSEYSTKSYIPLA